MFHGPQQGPGLQKLLGIEHVPGTVQALDGLFQSLGTLQDVPQLLLQYLGVQQLFTVFPFIQGFRLIEAFVTLQSYQGLRDHFSAGLRQFGLAHPGWTFHQNGFVQRCGQVDDGGDTGGTDIPGGTESRCNRVNVTQLGVEGSVQSLVLLLSAARGVHEAHNLGLVGLCEHVLFGFVHQGGADGLAKFGVCRAVA